MMMERKRVVVTGLGVVSPNGIGLSQFLESLKAGKSGIQFQPIMESLDFRCQVAGVPPIADNELKKFAVRYGLEKIISTGILYGCMAAVEAWKDAGLQFGQKKEMPDARAGCIFGTGSNGAEATMYQIDHDEKYKGGKLNPHIPIQSLANTVSVYINKIIGFGNQVTSNSSACSTGTEGLLMAYERIKNGISDRVLVGSSESKGEFVWSPFDAMFATAQGHNATPQSASCPLSVNATGFVPSAGAGALIVESLESAQERGAKIYAEILGGHINSGGQRGGGSMTIGNQRGMVRCIQLAMKECKITPSDIDLISGHLTSTIGDVIEMESWSQAGGYSPTSFPYINSTKSMIGHSLSASGSIESVGVILQLYHGFVHPSLNASPLHPQIAPLISKRKIPAKTIKKALNIVAKLSLGFGDVNACILFKKWNEQR